MVHQRGVTREGSSRLLAREAENWDKRSRANTWRVAVAVVHAEARRVRRPPCVQAEMRSTENCLHRQGAAPGRAPSGKAPAPQIGMAALVLWGCGGEIFHPPQNLSLPFGTRPRRDSSRSDRTPRRDIAQEGRSPQTRVARVRAAVTALHLPPCLARESRLQPRALRASAGTTAPGSAQK